MELIFAGTILVLNLGYLVYIDALNRRHAKQIDSLTTKIVAPHTVTANPTSRPVLAPTLEQRAIPLSEANPDDVMRALAVEAGEIEA